MFVAELTVSWFAESTGLLADSLDMFADSAVYGLALYTVGRNAKAKLRTAHAAGWIQAALAIGAIVEVARRGLTGSEPESTLMIGMATAALVANGACLWLVSKHREGGAHMKASIIFSANDVLANVGVIVAGALVALTGSPYPDLVIGTVIAIVVLRGAQRILRLR
jgi:Co/Zn/Cd efflux system component